jgi:hypothetical protein
VSRPDESDEDDALILWMLSLTPAQRLEVAQGFVDSVQALRNAKISPLLPMGTPGDLRFEASPPDPLSRRERGDVDGAVLPVVMEFDKVVAEPRYGETTAVSANSAADGEVPGADPSGVIDPDGAGDVGDPAGSSTEGD